MELFKQAARKKLRFSTNRGDITTEDLFDLPLTSRSGFDLDTLARGVSAELRSITEDSFVETKPDPRKADLTLKLDLLKDVIADRQEAKKASEDRAARQAKRALLLETLAAKEVDEIKGKTKEEILKELAEIDAG